MGATSFYSSHLSLKQSQSLLSSLLYGVCLFSQARKGIRSKHAEYFLFVMLLLSPIFGDHLANYNGFE